ncbi:trinucleotide repeat-containing gene 18 protein-like isoform X2 [Panonychus citri]|uniref:trinucleotide repeat-containing gene 18 protein-like isoform X2 n=1 Tax=Panonychus citri TaxID=50023 RepID=UPI002307AD82|nr:trinucleotide repeat-containing gene 18 protein-like isoform X2 [Panonychus citri]
MWRPWRKSPGNGTDLHNQNYSVPCEQCEASSISLSPSTMNTYTTLTPRNAISSSSTLTSTSLIDFNGHQNNHNHHFTNRHPLIQEQPEVLIIKSDCESLSDDEVKSNTGSDCYRTRFYYDSPVSGSPPPPLIYYPLDQRSYSVSNDISSSSSSIPTLPVASPEVLNFIKQRDLDRLVDRIENYNCNDTTVNSCILPRTMVDNETTEPFIPNEDDINSRQSSSMPINCCDGLTLLSALAEQRALEEESRLESDRCYPYPYSADFRPSDLLTTSSPLTNIRRLTLEPPEHRIQSVERPISTSSTDFNLKEDETCSNEPIFEPQINSPMPTTSPPPPPVLTVSPNLPSIIKPASSISSCEKKDSPILPPKSREKSQQLSKVKSQKITKKSSSTSSPAQAAKSKSKSESSSSSSAVSSSSSSSKTTTTTITPIELPLKKRKRQSSSSVSSNEYNFTRRSERLFVLDSYYLYGIQPPDARKELFEKTPPRSKKSAQKESSSTSSIDSSTSTTTNNTTKPISSSSSLSSSSSPTIKPSIKSNTSTIVATSPFTNNESCHQVENNQQDEVIPCDAKNIKSTTTTTISTTANIKPVKENNVYKMKRNAKSKIRNYNGNDNNSKFLSENEEWNWSGPGIKKSTGKPKSKKTFYKEIIRGNELIKIGDCAVFYSRSKPNLPYVGRIDSMWQSTNGSMIVRLTWFYHPEETKSHPNLKDLKGALFESQHYDQNDVRTILHKCSVLPWEEYQSRLKDNPEINNNPQLPKLYYLAGYYDPISRKVQISPEIPLKEV